MSRKVLLTGASGFAGAHMLKQLLTDAGNFVYCPVTYRHGGREDRIANLIPDRSISNHKIFEADLAYKKLDFDDLEIDCIINFASESHVDNSILRPSELVSNNVNLLINILESLQTKFTAKLFVVKKKGNGIQYFYQVIRTAQVRQCKKI
jgi:dTDP-glucose 4,6-dehydratase